MGTVYPINMGLLGTVPAGAQAGCCHLLGYHGHSGFGHHVGELSEARQASLGARGHLALRMSMLHKSFFLENVQLLFGVLCKPRKIVLIKPRRLLGRYHIRQHPCSPGWQQLLPSFRADILRSRGWEGQKLCAGRICFSISCLHICGKASQGHGQLRKCISLHSAACEVWQCPARHLLSKISFIFSCLKSPID